MTSTAPTAAGPDRSTTVPARPFAELEVRDRLVSRLFIAAVASASMIIMGLAALSIEQGWQHYRSRANVATENIAKLLERQVAEAISRTDLVLRSAELEAYREIEREGRLNPATFTAFLQQQQTLLPELTSLRATDAEGIVRYGPGIPPGSALSHAERPYFSEFKIRPKSDLKIHGPVLTGISKTWALVLVRGLYGPKGEFAGVVYAGLSTDKLRQDFSVIDLGRQGAATLRTHDLALVTRASAAASGEPLVGSRTVSKELKAAIAASPESGAYIARTALDQIERSNAYHRVTPYPLYVIVGLATDDYLADWRRECVATIIFAGLALLVTLAGSRLMFLAKRRQRVAVNALAESETRFSTMFRTSLIGMCIARADNGHIVDINDGFLEILGYERDEVIGRTTFELGLWADPAERTRMLDAMRVPDAHYECEPVFRRKDGVLGTAAISSARVTMNGVPHLVGVISDITDRKRAEDALRQSEARFAAVFRASLIGMCIARQSDGRFVDVNDSALRLFGFTREEMLGRTTRELGMWVRDEDRVQFVEQLQREGAAYDFEACFRSKSGVTGTLLVSSMNVRVNGEPHLVALFSDISGRKRMEAELRANEAELLEAQRLAGMGSWGWHPATNTARCSAQIYRLFERDPALPPAGYPEIRNYFTRDSWDRMTVSVEQSRAAGTPFTFDAEVVQSTGDRRWAQVRGEFLRDGNGKITEVRGTILDITDRKRLEDELREHREHLEALVQSRTEALLIAKEAAEAASRAKSAFLANMSHELRTPMNAIMGFTDLAMRRSTDPKTVDQLRKALGAARHLLSVINDVLDISKIEAERLVLEDTRFKLGSVTENVRSLIGARAAEKGLPLLIQLAPGVAELNVRGDPLRLSQVLLNLVGNAVKFTAHGSVTVRAALQEANAERVLVRYEVQDDGIGIDADTVAKLFTSFEQADNSMTRKYGGTGLGLSICKRLVEKMGGTIGVESRLGAGSLFWFTVGLQTDQLAPGQDGTRTEEVSAVQVLQTRHRGAMVLLVEDEPINQEVSTSLLESVGLKVDLAIDGLEAVEMAAARTYDLILMDMQMPRLDGPDATRRIRSHDGGADVPIIAMTANAFVEDKATCFAAGMDDFIAKPVKSETLFATILDWLDRTPPRRNR